MRSTTTATPEAAPAAPAAPNARRAASDEPVVAFRGVYKAFGDNLVLRGLDLEVHRGEILFIIGTSGVGKSVAIKHLIGLLRVDAGELWFDGDRIDALSERAFYAVRARVGMVFQHSTLLDSMTLTENVALPLRKHKRMSQRAALAEARERLAAVYLGDFADSYPATLSDGLRKRAAIARALTMDPEVVLLDEPTTGLDPISARRVDALIGELARRSGVTVIVVSHDLTSIFSVADRIAFLYQGRVHACAAPAAIRGSTDPVVAQFINGHASGPMETPGF